jgi:ribosomal protein L9
VLASDSPYTADHNTRSTEDAKQLDGAHQQLASHGLGYARPVLLSQKLSMVAEDEREQQLQQQQQMQQMQQMQHAEGFSRRA